MKDKFIIIVDSIVCESFQHYMYNENENSNKKLLWKIQYKSADLKANGERAFYKSLRKQKI